MIQEERDRKIVESLLRAYIALNEEIWDEQHKEKSMGYVSQQDADYHYKRGVEDAIKEIQENMPLPLSKQVDPADVLNEIPRYLRKKLLTKKVTKWIRVLNGPLGVAIPGSAFYDSKEAADHPGISMYGIVPVEIEVPL
jgi:hypothetical protein